MDVRKQIQAQLTAPTQFKLVRDLALQGREVLDLAHPGILPPRMGDGALVLGFVEVASGAAYTFDYLLLCAASFLGNFLPLTEGRTPVEHTPADGPFATTLHLGEVASFQGERGTDENLIRLAFAPTEGEVGKALRVVLTLDELAALIVPAMALYKQTDEEQRHRRAIDITHIGRAQRVILDDNGEPKKA